MGYVRVWDDFVVAAQRLFQEQPGRVRYSMKYRHCDGKLILKVTNNSEVLCPPPPPTLHSLSLPRTYFGVEEFPSVGPQQLTVLLRSACCIKQIKCRT